MQNVSVYKVKFDNGDYDGEQIIFDTLDDEDAIHCVWEMLDSQDFDMDSFNFSSRRLTISELFELVKGEDSILAMQAQNYLEQLIAQMDKVGRELAEMALTHKRQLAALA